MQNQIIEAIKARRSIRKFTDMPVSDQELETILEAGRWAPSGLNNQPWRFAIIKNQEKKKEIATLTKYSPVVNGAPALLAVFMDPEASYHRHKDGQAIGACIQNMLLAAYSLGLGAVWLGEILKNGPQVVKALGLQESMELQAVLAVGRPAADSSSRRQDLEQLIIGRF